MRFSKTCWTKWPLYHHIQEVICLRYGYFSQFLLDSYIYWPVLTAGDQGFLNSYYSGFPNAQLFNPRLSEEERRIRGPLTMERLSTLYNADVGLYMLANKVRLLSLTHSFSCCIYNIVTWYVVMFIELPLTVVLALEQHCFFLGVPVWLISFISSLRHCFWRALWCALESFSTLKSSLIVGWLKGGCCWQYYNSSASDFNHYSYPRRFECKMKTRV